MDYDRQGEKCDSVMGEMGEQDSVTSPHLTPVNEGVDSSPHLEEDFKNIQDEKAMRARKQKLLEEHKEQRKQ